MDVPVDVRKIIEQLELIDRAYFGKDRVKQMRAKMEDAIGMLDTKPIDMGKYFAILTLSVTQKKEKADLLFLRGKVLDFIPEYTK